LNTVGTFKALCGMQNCNRFRTKCDIFGSWSSVCLCSLWNIPRKRVNRPHV